MELPMDVTPELEQLSIEVLRQVEAKTDRFPRIDAETVGRIGVDHRRSAPKLEFHLGEQGGHELVRQRILIAQLQRDLFPRRQGEGRVLRVLPGGISLDHMKGLLLDDENHVGLVFTLIGLSKSEA